MCEQLQILRRDGYKQANVWFNVSYVWNHKCLNTCYPSINFFARSGRGENFARIHGPELYITDYLATALNMSMKFLKLNRLKKLNKETSMYFDMSNGDVISSSLYNFAPTHPSLKKIRPLVTPIYAPDYYVAIMSPARYDDLTIYELLKLFQTEVWLHILFCVVLVSLFLRLCRQSSEICKRSFCRQLFEMLLLITLEPRSNGLINEKKIAIQFVIAAVILSGFLMRKTFYGGLNAAFAVESYNYISDFSDLGQNLENEKLLFFNEVSYVIVKKRGMLPEDEFELSLHRLQTMYSLLFVAELLNGRAVYIGYSSNLQIMVLRYPYLPLKVSGIGQSELTLSFPIVKYSPLKDRLYKA